MCVCDFLSRKRPKTDAPVADTTNRHTPRPKTPAHDKGEVGAATQRRETTPTQQMQCKQRSPRATRCHHRTLLSLANTMWRMGFCNPARNFPGNKSKLDFRPSRPTTAMLLRFSRTKNFSEQVLVPSVNHCMTVSTGRARWSAWPARLPIGNHGGATEDASRHKG